MIDWSVRVVELTDTEGVPRKIVMTDEKVAGALQFHENRPEGFRDHEPAVRDSFDRFLDGIERIDAFVTSRLVRVGDVAPYLDYWARRVFPESNPPKSMRLLQLQRNIKHYHFDGADRLLRKLAARSRRWYRRRGGVGPSTVPPPAARGDERSTEARDSGATSEE
jgi:hypothetical protein